MFIPNREELAWAAGFFDGEGCTVLTRDARGKTKVYMQPQMSIHQADPLGKEMLQRFQTAVGGVGSIYGPCLHKKAPWRKPYYTYNVYGRKQSLAVVAMLWQFLGRVKKDQILRVFRAPTQMLKLHTMGEGKSMRDDPKP